MSIVLRVNICAHEQNKQKTQVMSNSSRVNTIGYNFCSSTEKKIITFFK